MRRVVLLLLLAGLVVPTSDARACDILQVETLDTALPASPKTVPAGRVLAVTLTVTRAGSPAPDIDVFATLDGKDFAVHKSAVTAGDGRARLELAVPRTAKGPVELDVEAFRTLVDLPCASVEEYDRNALPWGKVG